MKKTILLAAILLVAPLATSGDLQPADLQPADLEALAAEQPMLRVTLNDEAFIKGPRVLLSEVATIEGAGAEELADLEITTAPRPGSTNRIQSTLIESRIRDATGSSEKYKISGPSLIRATRMSQEILGVQLGDELRTYVLANLPWDPTAATIDITPPNFDVVVPDGDITVEWEENPNYKYLGTTSFRGSIYVDGKFERTVMGRVAIEAYEDVIVADRDIPRGNVIRASDLAVEKMAMSKAVRGTFTDPASVIGKVAKSTIFPGTVITGRKIDTPILVRRHQTVNIVSRIGSLVVRSQARSRDDGREGDLITCIDPTTKDTIQGVVQPNGTVEVL